MAYIKLTVKCGLSTYVRVYVKPDVEFSIYGLRNLLGCIDLQVLLVKAVNFFDPDDDLHIIMVDESGYYYWD